MCIGVPVKVIEAGELTSLCEGRNGLQRINMMLIGEQPVGTWVLNFLGSAREVLSDDDANKINLALEGLDKIMQNQDDVNIDEFFPDLT